MDPLTGYDNLVSDKERLKVSEKEAGNSDTTETGKERRLKWFLTNKMNEQTTFKYR